MKKNATNNPLAFGGYCLFFLTEPAKKDANAPIRFNG
jgi:hypothetical protein